MAKNFYAIMRHFVPRLEEHLTDDRLADLACNLLTLPDKMIARQHLASCASCSLRQARLEHRAEDVMSVYAVRARTIRTPKNRNAFLERVDDRLAAHVPRQRWSFGKLMIDLPNMLPIAPALAASVILGVATILSLVVWQQQRTPHISSNALLVRAERWDTAKFSQTPGVVYQAVKISTPHGATERKIYRDTQSKRRVKAVKLTVRDIALKENLMTAGVDWDEPLSASGYQKWHDSQHVREDEISREGRHLLTLTTTAPEGPIMTQSLTVRDSDFHPVRRKIAFRDSETIEIAEVEFKILPWSSVDPGAFEPLDDMKTANAREPRVLPFRLPALATPQQLDDAELSARLVLNQLHADTYEQIELKRDVNDVLISGLVDTDERKHLIEAQLRTIPHLAVAIQSLTHLPATPGGSESARVAVETTAPELSPLEGYLTKRGWSPSSITDLSHKLKRSALAISQESRAIGDLQSRFTSEQSHSLLASATLSELMFSHRQRLQDALAEERKLLGSALNSEVNATASNSSSLPTLAEKNLTLCDELTTSGTSSSRDGQTILAELAASAGQLTANVLHVDGAYRNDSAANGKK